MSTTFRPTITRQPSIIDCHVCERMAKSKVHHQVGDCAVCLLCDRPYCERHKGEEVDVCEINHSTYYRRHYKPGRIFPSMDARRGALGPNVIPYTHVFADRISSLADDAVLQNGNQVTCRPNPDGMDGLRAPTYGPPNNTTTTGANLKLVARDLDKHGCEQSARRNRSGQREAVEVMVVPD
ncbi:MAG: hypothetical protein Q9208_007842 [Pyrenodesmia sp. 3 TL-2023]